MSVFLLWWYSGVPLLKNSSCDGWHELVNDECANCPAAYRPVCACGRTYYNPCVADCL